jgi:hypothetical protein
MLKRGLKMKTIVLSVCMMLIFAVNSYAQDIVIPAGTQIEGTTIFGTFAPAENVNTSNFSLAIKATRNPVAVGGNEIPLKDCVIMGEVIADVSVKRAFFKASRIVCSNAKEPGGTLIKGYAVDYRDNKLGIHGSGIARSGAQESGKPSGKGKPASEDKPEPAGAAAAPGTPQRFVEIPADAKVFLFIMEAVSISIK